MRCQAGCLKYKQVFTINMIKNKNVLSLLKFMIFKKIYTTYHRCIIMSAINSEHDTLVLPISKHFSVIPDPSNKISQWFISSYVIVTGWHRHVHDRARLKVNYSNPISNSCMTFSRIAILYGMHFVEKKKIVIMIWAWADLVNMTWSYLNTMHNSK